MTTSRPRDAFDDAVDRGWEGVRQLDALLLHSPFDTDEEINRVNEEACRIANEAQYDLQTVSGVGTGNIRPRPWSDETKKQWGVYGEINNSLLRIGRRVNRYYTERDLNRFQIDAQELHAIATSYYRAS